ncbi:MAG TPA: hypothetical protein EYP21_02850 [Syntrophaceae bacterium]|nr:hypothetical protein [Syntrophaceae bacterium]
MKFIADVMLGKLAKWLRILGYDTLYYHKVDENRLLRDIQDGRILLTRNNRWRNLIPSHQLLFIRKNNPREQIREVIKNLNLCPDKDSILERCIVCNQILNSLPKTAVEGKVPEYIYDTSNKFLCCPRCNRIYWQGSHRDRMLKEIDEILIEQ